MIPLLSSAQIRDADAYTIAHEPIAPIDLMERASVAFVGAFVKHFPNREEHISVYCGTGNNGGDGLAIARLLKQLGFNHVAVKVARFSATQSADFALNFERLKQAGVGISELLPGQEFEAEAASIIIDALLGTGLNKPLEGDYARLVTYLNTLKASVIAVDVPTGFFTEGELPANAVVLKAHLVITFQQAKLNFLLPESASYLKSFEVVDIGLDKDYLGSVETPYRMIERLDVGSMLKKREPFSHKGTYGHALLIAGQPQTMGAALLCASACVHAGAGLTTVCIPDRGLTSVNTNLPEAMVLLRKPDEDIQFEHGKYSVIAIGPGLGNSADTLSIVNYVINNYELPVLLDADALNVLGGDDRVLKALPPGSVLTPHVKEFDRLFGEHSNWWQRLLTLQQKARQYKLNIVLKNRYTFIANPRGEVHVNPTGNPAMASGGMGDVLTGIIASLLAQGYEPTQACILGVYLHGYAGDELAFDAGREVVLAGQVAAQLPLTLAKLRA